ncbi:hypothetical protein KDL01_04230 [Actinospica durhamensis]|uniref:Uncharacterized protein n=1 Tax=Actinospica durhamensis TaxID=1508375 RepID=A0A941EKD8_9ACTN|nr:hypothetical protein [Actinospica durhamensis]MBR7832450.1 hypothetical protein [Actinospica durhamensis]
MAATTTAVPAPSGAGSAPAGLTPAQTRAWERLQAARAAMAQVPPLDPEFLAAERSYERLRRLNGDES